MSVRLIPAGGTPGLVARMLLGLADDPSHVRTNTDSALAFEVPEYLHDRFLAELARRNPPPQPAAGAAPDDPPRRRRAARIKDGE